VCVACQCYDRSYLDVCRRYDWSNLEVYLLMLLSVSCGKMTLLVLLHLNDPPNCTLAMATLSCSAYSFYQLMLERRCQSLGKS
jgi:hypothetical protein